MNPKTHPNLSPCVQDPPGPFVESTPPHLTPPQVSDQAEFVNTHVTGPHREQGQKQRL